MDYLLALPGAIAIGLSLGPTSQLEDCGRWSRRRCHHGTGRRRRRLSDRHGNLYPRTVGSGCPGNYPMTVYRLSENCAVSSQIQPADVAAIAAEGFTTIVCNRPDGEDFGQPTAGDVAAACEAQGVTFKLIPIDRNGLTMDMVEDFRSAIDASEGPVLAYCRSGQRSSVIWQASGSP